MSVYQTTFPLLRMPKQFLSSVKITGGSFGLILVSYHNSGYSVTFSFSLV